MSKRFANFFAKKLQKVVFSRHCCILHPLLCNVAPILMDSETLDENELGDRQANGTSMLGNVRGSCLHLILIQVERPTLLLGVSASLWGEMACVGLS